MRVALVSPYSLSRPGGVQQQVVGLAHSLRSLGVDARVLAPCDTSPPEPGITGLGRAIGLPANGSVAPVAVTPDVWLRTRRAICDEEPDVVHVHEPFAPIVGPAAVLSARVPVVSTFHRSGAGADYRLFAPLTRRLASRFSAMAAVSTEARDTAGTVVPEPIEVLFNGVDVVSFAKADPHPTAGPTVLFLGRHEHRKGLAVLLAALRHLPSELRVWVAGEGPETAGLRAQYGHDTRVEWLGQIPDFERARRLRGADVFVAPSLGGESFGLVLLEAMAAGAPAVVSDLPGYRAAARGGRAALLVPPDEPRALAAGIRAVLEDEELANRLRVAGDERATEYSMDRLAERYLDLYTRAGGRPG